MSRRKFKPLLWKTTDRPVPCYFLGTMHLADTWYNVVPRSLMNTFDKCDALCVEFDILNASKSQQKTAGTALKRTVPEDIMDTVNRRTKTVRRRIENASKLTPKNMQLCGLDGYLLERASVMEKPIISLETFKEQITSMKATGEPDAVMDYGTGDPIEQVQTAFLAGDPTFFETMSNRVWGTQAANWCNRHVRMAGRLLDRFRSMPETSFFVAIGAIHLLSPASVLEMMVLGGVPLERV